MAEGTRLRKYGVEATICFELYEIDGVDFRVDAASATGDINLVRDGAAEEQLDADAFVDEGRSYSLVLSATEMQAARIIVYIVDQTSPKAWLDKAIVIETYGNASAQHAFDLDTASVAQGADNNTILSSLTIANGAVDAKITYIMDTILTEGGAGRLAAAFIKLFDVVTPLLVASDVMRGTDGANTTVPDAAGTAPTAVEVRQEMDSNSTELAKIGTIPNLDGGGATIGGAIGKLADDNGGADYDATNDSLERIRETRTLDAADYVVVGDTIAGVTLVDTVTTNTDLVSAADIKTALEADGGDLSSLMEALVNKLVITEADGNTEIFNDAGVSQGTVNAAFTTDGTYTTRLRIFV